MKRILFLLIITCQLSLVNCFAQLTLSTFSTGFSVPVDVKHAGDKRIFVVEQAGTIKIMDTAGVHFPANFLDITANVLYSAGGERGLLGLAFDPNYKTNGFFYVDYTRKPDGATRISRFKVSANPDIATAASEKILLTIYQPYSNHNGGHVYFNPNDHYLYIGMGDGGSGGDPGNRAQNLDSLLGKILRIDVSDTSVNYKIPPTNPFANIAGERGEIWDYGVRNPWRWSFDRWNGDFWIGDVGQDLWEEIDYEPAHSPGGVNYGWRCYEGNNTYNTTVGCGAISNYTFPVTTYNHSTGGCATIGGYVYRGAEFSNLFGKYYFSDECTSSIGIHSITHTGSTFTDVLALAHSGTFVSMGEDYYGEMYVTDYSGTIYKFQGTACSPVAFISDNSTLYGCGLNSTVNLHTPMGRGFHYQWYLNGSPVGSDSAGYVASAGGTYTVTVTDRNGCTASATGVTVQLVAPPTVSFAGLDTFYCAASAGATLVGTPAGGTFSGPGIAGNVFSPATAGIGTYSIIYSYTDPTTLCSNSDTIITRVDACAGITNRSPFQSFSLYPNPNNGEFTLGFYIPQDETLKAEIVDVLGKSVYAEELRLTTGNHSVALKPAALAKGVYTLKLGNNKGSSVKRFVVN